MTSIEKQKKNTCLENHCTILLLAYLPVCLPAVVWMPWPTDFYSLRLSALFAYFGFLLYLFASPTLSVYFPFHHHSCESLFSFFALFHSLFLFLSLFEMFFMQFKVSFSCENCLVCSGLEKCWMVSSNWLCWPAILLYQAQFLNGSYYSCCCCFCSSYLKVQMPLLS